MFIGAGQMGAWRTAQEEKALFYGHHVRASLSRGYGHTSIDPLALAYYRYERAVEDIAIFCERILLTNEGGLDRQQMPTVSAIQFPSPGRSGDRLRLRPDRDNAMTECRRLAEHLDRLPGGFPPRDAGAELCLLEGLFTLEGEVC